LVLSKNALGLIKDLADVNLEENRSLTKFSTMKALSHGSIIHVRSTESLKKVLEILRKEKKDFRVIGWGANFVLPERPSYFLVKLDLPFDKSIFSHDGDRWKLPASIGVNQMTSVAMKYGLSGWECLTGIPGSLGGAIYMNAGTSFGEMGNLVEKVWLLDSLGQVKEVVIDEKSFSYRKNHFVKKGEVIISAELKCFGRDENLHLKIKKYLKLRQETQPLREKTCGCMFKNYKHDISTCPAGQFLDIMGLKGFGLNGFRVSPKHANFLENHQDGKYDGLATTMSLIERELNSQYGIDFEQEIQT